MNIITDSDVNFTLDEGAVAPDAINTGLIAAGCIVGAGWSIGSSVHTLIAAPLATVGVLGTGAALTGAGVYRQYADDLWPTNADKQTVDVESQPA